MYRPLRLALPVFLISGMVHAQSSAAAEQYIGKPDCRIFNPRPVADESVSWNGGCKDGYADGNGILIWTVSGKEDSRYEGGMRRGRKHGPSAQQDANGVISWGNFVDGQRDGKTQIEQENVYTMHAVYDHGVIKGPVTVKYVSGDKYQGHWGPHGPEGEGTKDYVTGGSFSGVWKDGKWYANGKITYPNGIQRELRSDIPVTPDAATAKEPRREYRVKNEWESLARMESLATGGSVPFNKGYKDLPPADQRTVREWFRILQDDDVPPYPVKGSLEIIKAISAAHSHYGDYGMLWMDVLIDEQGVPKDVMVRRTPGKEVSEFAAKILLVSKFTPATCGGKPCAMRYPVRVDLTQGH